MGHTVQLVIAGVERKNGRAELAGIPCALEQHLGCGLLADHEESLALARGLETFKGHSTGELARPAVPGSEPAWGSAGVFPTSVTRRRGEPPDAMALPEAYPPVASPPGSVVLAAQRAGEALGALDPPRRGEHLAQDHDSADIHGPIVPQLRGCDDAPHGCACRNQLELRR